VDAVAGEFMGALTGTMVMKILKLVEAIFACQVFIGGYCDPVGLSRGLVMSFSAPNHVSS
jgi:hypothetical protein